MNREPRLAIQPLPGVIPTQPLMHACNPGLIKGAYYCMYAAKTIQFLGTSDRLDGQKIHVLEITILRAKLSRDPKYCETFNRVT